MTACYNNILLLLLFHFSGLKALLLQLVNFADTPIHHKHNQTIYHFTIYILKKTPCAL